MKNIVLTLFVLLAFAHGEIVQDSTNSTALDTETGLMWQDNSAVTSNSQSWADAVVYCNDLVLGVYIDWRLPNAVEISTLLVWDEGINNYKTGFANSISNKRFWSSTTYADDTTKAYYMSTYGEADLVITSKVHDPSYPKYVRCVRQRSTP